MERKKRAKRVGIFLGLSLSLAALLVAMVACGGKKPEVTTGSTGTQPGTLPGTNPAVSVDPGDYYSPSGIAISADGAYAYVSDETGGAVYKIKIEDSSIAAAYDAGLPVHNVVVDGDKVYATAGALGGKLLVLNADLSLQGEVVTGHTPNDVVVTGNTAYVANRFSNSVSVVNLSDMTETKEIAVTREPLALALNGSDLYVACHLPGGAADAEKVSANVDVIDTSKNELSKTINLVNGASGVKDILISPDGKTAYVSHLVAHYQYPTTQLDGGWIYTNGITVIDTAAKESSYTYLLDDVDRGAGNPWGLAISDNGNYLFTAISGTGEVIRTDLAKIGKLVSNVTNPRTPTRVDKVEDIVNDIAFAANIKTRTDLGGIGARAMAYHDGKIYVAEYFSGDIKVVDESKMTVSKTLTVGTQPEADDVRQGEIYWNDATICYQNWQSCASCHPDARVDGFNWDNLNDGVGTMKQAKSMMITHRTPPVMVTGIRADADTAVAAGMKYILFNASTSGVIEPISAYLKALVPEQSPYLNDDGTLTETALKGKELFAKYNCATCHPAPYYTDMQKHTSMDLQHDPSWENRDMDTATLIEIWRTAPWGYNGHHTDMVEYIKSQVSSHGQTISDDDAKALAEYVLSIGWEGETYGAEQIFNSDGSYNKIIPGTTITEITIRQQEKSASDATVTFTLCDKNGKEIGKATGTVKAGDIRALSKIVFESAISVPESLETGAYYTVTIKDSSGNDLASELKIKY